MSITIEKVYLDWKGQKLGALAFLPDPQGAIQSAMAIFTHGFTSHKGSLLNWPVRLSEEGVSALIFDLPGHYLGTFSEVDDLPEFFQLAPDLFLQAYQKLQALFLEHFPLNDFQLNSPDFEVVVGGHSLGALLALKALQKHSFDGKKSSALCVGLGLPEKEGPHLFQTPFYKSTLAIRGQLVSPALAPDKVFPWIFEAKESLKVQDRTIHFITGQDDLVVGKNGTQRLADLLLNQGNQVSVEMINKLPHHTPEMAAGMIKKYFKSRALIAP